MPKPSSKIGHGGKHRRDTGAESATAKSVFPLRSPSSRTGVSSKAADVKPTATDAGGMPHKKKSEEGARQLPDDSAPSTVTGSPAAGELEGRQIRGKSIKMGTPLPASADRSGSPVTANLGSEPQARPKTSVKCGLRERRQHEPQLPPSREHAAKPSSVAASTGLTTNTETYKEISAIDSTATPGLAGPTLTPPDAETPECLSPPGSEYVSSFGRAHAIPSVRSEGSGGLSATSAAAKFLPDGKEATAIASNQVSPVISSVNMAAESPNGPASPTPTATSPAENRPPRHGARRKPPMDAEKAREAVKSIFTSLAGLEEMAKASSPVTNAMPKKRIHNRSKVAIAVAGLGVCAFFCFAYFFVFVRNLPSKFNRFCSTADCYHHATLLTKRINWSLDPCEDFQAFVCSAWEPLKEHRDRTSSALDDLRYSWYDRFPDTLEKGALKFSAGSKPLTMYKMCRYSYPHNDSQLVLIHSILNSSGLAWPEPPTPLQPPLGLLVGLSYQWQWPFWITVNRQQPMSSGRQRLFVRQGMALPILWHHHRSVSPYYLGYWKQFLALLYPDSAARPAVNEQMVNEIRTMEADVISTLNAVYKASGKGPAAFSFNEIGSHVPNASAAEWVSDFQYGTQLTPPLTAVDMILVSDVSLLDAIGKLMTKYSRQQLNIHISWMVVQHFALIADYPLLVGYTGSKQKAALYLPVFCAFHVESSFKVLITTLAYSTRFSARDREIIDKGFSSLISSAIDKVNSSSWMEEEVKLRAFHKLSSLMLALWPPESLLSDSELQRLFAHFPEKEPSFAQFWVNARMALARINTTLEYEEALMLPANNYAYYADYDVFTNAVELAIGAVYPPAFYSNGTNAMLYGGLLFLTAMQIVKAIDNTGIKWIYNRTAKEEAFMSAAALREFNARTECQHYRKHESIFPEVPAVEIAYAAFRESHRQGQDEHLDLDETLPEDKVFFMTLCFLTCSRPGYESAITADCNKIVRNSEAFARAYSCSKGAKMNPGRQCSFFA